MPDPVDEAIQRFFVVVAKAAEDLSHELTRLAAARTFAVMQRAFDFDDDEPKPPKSPSSGRHVHDDTMPSGRVGKARVHNPELASVGRDRKRTIGNLIEYVKKHPGYRIEQLNTRLGTTTKSLSLQIRKAIASGKLLTKGYGRARTYHPGKKA